MTVRCPRFQVRLWANITCGFGLCSQCLHSGMLSYPIRCGRCHGRRFLLHSWALQVRVRPSPVILSLGPQHQARWADHLVRSFCPSISDRCTDKYPPALPSFGCSTAPFKATSHRPPLKSRRNRTTSAELCGTTLCIIMESCGRRSFRNIDRVLLVILSRSSA